MKSPRTVFAVIFAVAALFGMGLVSAPANALAKPTVTIKSSNYKPYVGASFRITGTVSGKSAGATVTLQRYTSDGWRNVPKTKMSNGEYVITKAKVKPSGKYVLVPKGPKSKTTYRVHVKKTKRIAAANSKKIVIASGGSRPACPSNEHWTPGGQSPTFGYIPPGCYPNFG